MNKYFDNLVELIAKLPGIGPRHATRIALFLVSGNERDVQDLAGAIAHLPQSVRLCTECFNISDVALCPICSDTGRDDSSVMVVEKVSDLQAVERSGIWKGRYHVLGGTIDPVGRSAGSHIRIPELIHRVAKIAKDRPLEVVLATGTDAGGEATALYIKEELTKSDNLSVTRLGRGLATGAHLEYADELTLRHSLESRK